jgi:hypothetical protein
MHESRLLELIYLHLLAIKPFFVVHCYLQYGNVIMSLGMNIRKLLRTPIFQNKRFILFA